MARYFASGEQTLIADLAAADTALTVTSNASTPNRGWVYEINFGNYGSPADLTSLYLVGRVTAVGTATARTPTKLDPADRAAQSVASEDHSGEPTYQNTQTGLDNFREGDLLRVALNHRGTMRWVAPPDGEFIYPAVANNGVGIKASHGSATTEYFGSFHWRE
jgi:hypothetical protein